MLVQRLCVSGGAFVLRNVWLQATRGRKTPTCGRLAAAAVKNYQQRPTARSRGPEVKPRGRSDPYYPIIFLNRRLHTHLKQTCVPETQRCGYIYMTITAVCGQRMHAWLRQLDHRLAWRAQLALRTSASAGRTFRAAPWTAGETAAPPAAPQQTASGAASMGAPS